MSPDDAFVLDDCLDITVFRGYWKHTPHGAAWSVTRIKAAARSAFDALDDVTDEDALWGVAEGYKVALEACLYAIPEWCDEFERRFNERLASMTTAPTRFEVRPAIRAMRNIIIGICGAAGGGKTCSALRLATGLANGGDIVLIDTECGKATEFAPRNGEAIPGVFDPELPLFRFGVIDLSPPFSPDRFRMAVTAAARARPKVLIIDNISDEMHGEGGQLDLHDNAPPTDKFGWIEPKRQHRQFVNRLTTYPWYVILTIRAKERIRPATAVEKKLTGSGIINEGWLPQCDSGWYYTTNLLQLIDGGAPNGALERPWKCPPALGRIITHGQPLTEDIGRRIAEWAAPTGTWEDGEQ